MNSKSRIISTDEDPSLWIESSAIINLHGVSTKLNKYIVFTMQIYKKLIKLHYFYLILYSETTDRGEITVTTTFTSGLDLCIFPCFKYIVYQINSFALIAK